VEKQRLSKFLSAAGVTSRRKAESLIRAGRVCVNGEVAVLPQTPVGSGDWVAVDGAPVAAEEKVYYLLNKPKGYVCSARPTARHRTVLELFQDCGERLFTVGRLDADTTGLLLVTNDGNFANRVIHPRNEVHKEYLVKVNEQVDAAQLLSLSRGAWIERAFVVPIRVRKVRGSTLRITVAEGRKREVRRLCVAAGLSLRSLQRIRLGNLLLGNLPIGSIRSLSPRECQAIFSC
jgi:23S rRNA pseudouridine2605 synthase